MNPLKRKGTLTSLQIDLLKAFSQIPDSHFFYLTGGTALSEFYLGHRRSFDLDFFTSQRDLVPHFSKIVEEGLRHQGYELDVTRRFASFVEFEAKRKEAGVVVHLAYDSPFRFEEPQVSEFGVKVNDYRDLVVDKLLTFFGRWKHRDAVDLHIILKTEPIVELIKMAKQKDPGFDLYWFCIALKEVEAFPDEIEKWPVDLLVELNAKDLKSHFLKLAHDIMVRVKESR